MRKNRLSAAGNANRIHKRAGIKVSGRIVRTWRTMPADAVLSTMVLVDITGVHPATIKRHANRGLLSSSISVTKAQAERYLKRLEAQGGIRVGRPRKETK